MALSAWSVRRRSAGQLNNACLSLLTSNHQADAVLRVSLGLEEGSTRRVQPTFNLSAQSVQVASFDSCLSLPTCCSRVCRTCRRPDALNTFDLSRGLKIDYYTIFTGTSSLFSLRYDVRIPRVVSPSRVTVSRGRGSDSRAARTWCLDEREESLPRWR